jgi:hypothetical protein
MDKVESSFFPTRTKTALALPRIVIPNGSIEALKWLALIFMTGDHVNKYLFNETLPVLYQSGRFALPIFVFVLAYNLARPGSLERGVYVRTMTRLGIFGAIASIPFIALGDLVHSIWPANVLFALFGLAATLYLAEQRRWAAAALVFVLVGSSVEFWWPALILGIAIWSYCRRPSWTAALIALIAWSGGLWVVNENLWALGAIPLIAAVSLVDLKFPRLKWAFYGYYPLHLTVLWLIRIPMAHAGYLFF